LFFPAIAILTIVLLLELWPILAGLLFVMFVARLFIIKIALNRLNESKIFIPSLLYDLVVPYFKLFYRWYFNNSRQKHKWKVKV
jgi:hypothetical protein